MDTERLLMPEMLEGKECRGGRVELLLTEEEAGLGREGRAVAMLLAARVSMCALWLLMSRSGGYVEMDAIAGCLTPRRHIVLLLSSS